MSQYRLAVEPYDTYEWNRAAKRKRMNLSEWIRDTCRHAAAEQLYIPKPEPEHKPHNPADNLPHNRA